MRTLRPCLLLCLTLSFACSAKAQFRAGASGLFVKAGTILSVDGLSLTPSAGLPLNDTEISRTSAEISFPRYKSVRRSYEFTKTISFAGTAGIRVLASELNGNEPSGLKIAWSAARNAPSAGYIIAADGQLSAAGDQVQSTLLASSISMITAVSPLASLQVMEVTNFLTPNGDGVNDTWIVQNIQLYPGNEAKVFDRSGRLVYNKKDYDNSWSGTVNGLPLAESTYYYLVTDASGGLIVKGYITITR